MTAKQLKEKYFNFFKEKGHIIIPSASLIPEHDPSVLFTTAGMHPLVPYLLGEKHPAGKRLVNVQKCLRTDDIEDVGDPWHNTFFEMLGNWSLGDYFKEEMIEMSFEFLTSKKWLNLDPSRIYITVFAGDGKIKRDEESIRLWQEQFKKVGIKGEVGERIFLLGREENWWGPVGEIGPCGPDTEMFYDTLKKKCSSNCRPGCSCGKYAEIWNDVFMEYEKKIKNQKSKIKEKVYEYVPLKQKNVDTGMGVERTVAVLQGKDNIYETELFQPIVVKIKELIKDQPTQEKKFISSLRIIADHLRAATFILGDEYGVVPSNLDQGYVLRRLIRRAIRHGKIIGIDSERFCSQVAEVVIANYSDDYPELKKNKERILQELDKEEEKFSKALARGLKELEKISIDKVISGQEAFNLFSTYGFPLEMTKEIAKERGLKVEEKSFWQEFKKHQEISRQGAEKKFKGGLADQRKETVRLHTATHLLQQALRDALGNHVKQRGSNITPERLRFDFSHPKKLTQEEIKKVEEIVNQKIKENLPVTCQEMTVEEAKKQGALGFFEAKYGQRVKVYSIGNYSKEICGGPHVKSTGELGHFKIVKEKAVSAGVRRIKAILNS